MKLIPTFLKSLFKTNEEELEKYRNSAEYKEWVNRYKSLVSTKPGERKTSYTRHKGVPRSWESRKFKTPNLASNASFGEPKKHQDSKGYNTGEENVKTQLELLKSKCWILHDITLKMDNGNTCQVDHVVISNFGVFVLETKKRKGTIVGAPNDLKWHVLNENGKYIESFYSPLKQNAVHTSRLVEKISGKVTTPFPVIPLLVFQEDDDYMMLSEG
ncbi:MAG: nuclease-related domain-containing protein, partial [Bacteroidota bacterium]